MGLNSYTSPRLGQLTNLTKADLKSMVFIEREENDKLRIDIDNLQADRIRLDKLPEVFLNMSDNEIHNFISDMQLNGVREAIEAWTETPCVIDAIQEGEKNDKSCLS